MEWFQYPLPTYAERILTSFICCGWAYGAIFCQLPLPPLKLSQIWEGFWNYGSLLGCKWHHCTVAEALIQHGMVPTSPPKICKVVDNLHMLWMGIWRHILPITITTTWVVPDLGSLLKLWFPAGRQMTPLCSCWRSNPTWNGFHTPSKDMKDDW